MIYGIGVDLVSLERIKDIYSKYGAQFADKILSDREISQYTGLLCSLNSETTCKILNQAQDNLIAFEKKLNQLLSNAMDEHNSNNVIYMPHNTQTSPMQGLNGIYSFLGKAWAAKEALSKALGTGINSNCRFKDMSVLRNALGKPYYCIEGNTESFFLENVGSAGNIHLSLTDEHGYVVAMCVIS